MEIIPNVKTSSWEIPKRPPRDAQERLGRPRKAREASRQPPELPGAPQERPQSRLESASKRPWRPNKAHQASKSPPEASRSLFLELHGAISHPPVWQLPHNSNRKVLCSKLSCVQNLCKHTSSIARRACLASVCGLTSTCGLVRRRTAGQGVLIHVLQHRLHFALT